MILEFFKKTTSRLFAGEVLLFGVMMGLFFSNAEGIRLLPFPSARSLADHPEQLADRSFESRYNPGTLSSARKAPDNQFKVKRSVNGTGALPGQTALSVSRPTVAAGILPVRTGQFIPVSFRSAATPRGPPAI
jgi:hypothetical protein